MKLGARRGTDPCSGNVWRDFGYPDADIRQAKGIIAARITGALDDRRLSTRSAAELTAFAAADFARVRDAACGRFTLDCLIRMPGALDGNPEVHVTVAPLHQQPGQTGVGRARKKRRAPSSSA